MGFVSHLRGIGSGAIYPADAIMNLCPRDGRPVEIVLDLERLSRERGADGWHNPGRADMWRFGGLLPLDADDPDDRRWIVSKGEGHTPLIDMSEDPLARRLGIRLALKQEGWAQPGFGANPTRSFKDRGMAMTVSMARRLGLHRLVVPTQGNAGDSLAHYALAADIEVAVVMPSDTPAPILDGVRALARRHRSISIDLVEGTIREAGARAKAFWIPRGYFSVATFQEPGWRIEGKKTMGLEVAEPAGPGSGWRLPDVVVYPAGGGTGLLGMWKAFSELEGLGLIGSDRPRMIAVQSDATRPLVDAFESGAEDTAACEAGETIAVGLNVPGGVGHFRVLEILRDSDGGAVSVSDEDMGRVMRHYLEARGWWLTPEGAATLAVLPMLRDRGLIAPSERVVAFNTGSAKKYRPLLGRWLGDGDPDDGG